MSATARGLLITKLADLIMEHKVTLANLETLDNGKPYEDSLLDIDTAVSSLKYQAGYADKIHGKTIPSSNGINCLANCN